MPATDSAVSCPRPPSSDDTFAPLSVAQSAALDGLRGLAILSVVAFHLGYERTRWGFLGVDMFFTLSGFVITKTLVEEYARTGSVSLTRFYLRRAGRLLPALLLLCGALAIASTMIAADGALLAKTIGWTLVYVLNWVIVAGLPVHGALSHTWSLAVEEQFYLVWPLTLVALLRTARRRATRVAILAGMVALVGVARLALWLTGASIQRLYNGSDLRLDSLLLGAALYLSGTERGWRFPRWWSSFGMLTFLAYVLTSSWDRAYASDHLYAGGLTIVALGTGAAILAVLDEGSLVSRIARAAPFRWTGLLSYSLYLWHYPVFVLLRGRPAAAVFCAVTAAMLSYHLVEAPIRSAVRSMTQGPLPPKRSVPAAETA